MLANELGATQRGEFYHCHRHIPLPCPADQLQAARYTYHLIPKEWLVLKYLWASRFTALVCIAPWGRLVSWAAGRMPGASVHLQSPSSHHQNEVSVHALHRPISQLDQTTLAAIAASWWQWGVLTTPQGVTGPQGLFTACMFSAGGLALLVTWTTASSAGEI